MLGLALFTFKVLPQMDAVKGAMLTNSVCFIPAVLSESCSIGANDTILFDSSPKIAFQRRFSGTFRGTKTYINCDRCRSSGYFDSVDSICGLATGYSGLSNMAYPHFDVSDFVALVGELRHGQQFIS